VIIQKIFIHFLLYIVQRLDNGSAEKFQPSTSSDLCEFICDFSDEKFVFSAENCLE
jgi:hypothetical protein